MLQAGLEPATLAFLFGAISISLQYKHHALPTELLEQNHSNKQPNASFGNRTQDLPLTRRMHYHYAKEAGAPGGD